jgi:hypothetical protein
MDTAEPSVETLRLINVKCDELAAERVHVGLEPALAAPSAPTRAAPAHAAPAASAPAGGASSTPAPATSGFASGVYSTDSESARLDLKSETRTCANSATKKAQENGKGKEKGKGENKGNNNKKGKGNQINMGDANGEEKEKRGSLWAFYEAASAFVAGRYTSQCKEMTKPEVESNCILTYFAGCQEMVKLQYWKPSKGGHRTLASSAAERCAKKDAVWVKYKEVRAVVVNEIIPLFHNMYKQGLPSGVQVTDTILQVKQAYWSHSLTPATRSRLGANAEMPEDWTSGPFIVFEIYGPLGAKDESVCVRWAQTSARISTTAAQA